MLMDSNRSRRAASIQDRVHFHRSVPIAVCAITSLLFPFIVSAQSNDDCLTCHGDKSMTMERHAKQVSIYVDKSMLGRSPHKKLVCVACHVGFDANNVPHKERIEPVRCFTCHKEAPLKHQFHPKMIQANGRPGTPYLSCKECHGTHNIVSPKVPGSKFHSSNIVQACGECHGDVEELYFGSEHGKEQNAGVQGAPNCITCHRNLIVAADGGKKTADLKIAQEKICLSCHLDKPKVREHITPAAGFIAAYQSSVHGAALLKGNENAANCIDCHGSHTVKKGSNPGSSVNKLNIPQTCARCHEKIAEEYRQSVHGAAVAKGVMDAPVCTDCHGEHNILKHNDPKSPVAVTNLSTQVCSPCHSSVRLTAKYGITSDRFQTFSASYHGLANKAGNVEVANCASCHSSHNIKPSSDSTSTVNKANLVVTCGKCHPGANERFTMGSVHVTLTAKEEPVLYWVSIGYILLIISIIGGMIVHNILDFVKKSKRKLLIRRGIIVPEHPGHRLYLRMSLNERIQHGALLLSFGILVLTGFALKFPDAWWVVPIRNISPIMFNLRGIVHRISAAFMVVAGIYHVYYVMVDPRGRQLIRDLLPKLQDVTDAIGVMKYNLGLSANKPQFGRFSYIEKSEYWALLWGTVVMSVTGIILWFDNTFLGILTKLWWDVAGTIHYFEAWLATLAILAWHFYFVIFNPDIYPINLAFWKGTLTEEEMSEEHALELAEIKRAEMLERLRLAALKEMTKERVNQD